MPGFQAPDKQIVKENILLKAARGQAPLIKLYGNLNPESAKVKRLPSLDLREDSKQKLEKLLRIGVVRQLALPLDPISDSAFYSIAEGDVRVAAIVSPGSLRTRLHFQSMSLPTGARVFVYSMSDPDEFYGPYEGRGASDDGTFWTPPLTGEGVVIEYFTPAGLTFGDLPFRISEVSHNYKDLPRSTDSAGACNLEVPAEWGNVAKSVGLLDFMTGGFEALCTGTLLSDSDLNSDHQVLTANHCISTQSEAQSVTVYWNYNSGDVPPGGTPITQGADLLVTGTASDFTLLRLTGSLPGGLFFSGWDANPVVASTSVTGIHHPQASHKRISFGTTNSDCAAGLPGPCANFTGVTWNQGTTEPGSSGSGLWTGTSANAMLVGTLTGGFASCNSPTGSDFYGRFSVTYPNIVGFLTNSCVSGINPTSQSFSANGGTDSITVTAPAGCNWTSSSTAAFLTITSGSSGTGSGTINFSVAANNGLQRSGSIVVGRQVFNVNQAAGGVCAPTPISVGQTINGTLSTSDCPLGDGSYVDAYSFNATSNPDGSILAIDDDGGGGTNSRIPPGNRSLALPTTGSYTILASSFDAGATGAYSLTLSQPVQHTLTVVSQNPSVGVNMSVNLPDNNGVKSGATPFTLTYDEGTGLNVFAPGILPNGNVFQKWQKDGIDTNQPQTALVIMDADHTWTAVYGPPPLFALTVASSNPENGVSITMSPNDYNGLGNGTTQFVRNYPSYQHVTLTAPATAPNGNLFQKWRRDNFDWSTSTNTTVIMEAPYTMTAVYVAPVAVALTIASSNPSSGVNITVSPNDNGGLGDGTTQLTRTYNQGTTITLTAPATAGGNNFDTWQRDGSNWSFSRSTSVTMDTNNHTMTAVYLGSAPPKTVQFSPTFYSINEGDPSGRVNITLTRSGDTTNSASVNYATNDAAGLTNCNVRSGIASPRCDYSNTIGTATWAAGDASAKTFSVAIVNDSYAEGTESFTISLNSIDSTNFFVRQQYLDFLGREPDPPGLAGWASTINNCSGDTTQCDRIHVSQLFFQSAEFQDRGYFVYRFYPVAFGRKPDYGEFVTDLARVSGFLDANQLEAAKLAFINAFMARPAFANTYSPLTNQQYVDMLLNTAGVTLSSRQAMIDGLNNSTMTRGQVLRQIVESTEVSTKYNHQAYAVMEYFGYLRRQPDSFYLQWIAVLDATNDPRGMVTGFVTSQEYRNRFGP